MPADCKQLKNPVGTGGKLPNPLQQSNLIICYIVLHRFKARPKENNHACPVDIPCFRRSHRTGGTCSSGRKPGCSDERRDRKSTRLNSSHVRISYAVFCLKKKKQKHQAPGLGNTRPRPPGPPGLGTESRPTPDPERRSHPPPRPAPRATPRTPPYTHPGSC